MSLIYHITEQANWEFAKKAGYYEAPSLKEEGFIHCSEEQQVDNVMERYFSGKKQLVKLVIETSKLTSKLIYEWSPSVADTFPHIYGPINLDAIIDVVVL